MSDRPWPPAPLRWPDPPLRDGVVRLDAMRDDDAPAIVEGAGDADTARWIPVPVPYALSDAEEFLAQHRLAAEQGTLLNLAIRQDGERALQGSIGARFQARAGECEIGYWLHPRARGQGLTARAIRLLAGHVFEAVGVHRVELLVDPANVPSQRVCAAAGCTSEGLRRAASPAPRSTGHDPMLVYSLLPADLA